MGPSFRVCRATHGCVIPDVCSSLFLNDGCTKYIGWSLNDKVSQPLNRSCSQS